MSRRRRAITLVELLVSVLILGVLGSVLYSVFGMTFRMHDVVIGQNNAFTDTRKGIDLMADHIRNAQRLETTPYNAVVSGTIDDLTYYWYDGVTKDSNGTITGYVVGGSNVNTPHTLRVRKNGSVIEMIDGGTTTTLASNIASLTLTYYKMSTGYTGAWSTTTDPNAPTNAELPRIAGIEIKVGVARDGYTTEYKTMVRLRNSPRKTAIDGL